MDKKQQKKHTTNELKGILFEKGWITCDCNKTFKLMKNDGYKLNRHLNSKSHRQYISKHKNKISNYYITKTKS